jgi:EF hand
MKTISKFAVSSAVLMTLATGLAFAQQNAAPTPPAPSATTDAGSDNGPVADNGPHDCMGGEGMGDHGRRHGRSRGDDMCREGRGGHRGMRHTMIIDSNGDGFIGPDEAASIADAMFTRIDQNHDNVIDESEVTAMADRHGWRAWFGGATPADVTAKLKQAFAERDADKDGKVTKLEFMTFAQSRYASLDTAKDGKVSPWAFRALPRL